MEEQQNKVVVKEPSEVVGRERKEIEALIESVGLMQPDMRSKLSIAAIWTFMQMPDEAFGWSTYGNDNRAMTPALKRMAIIAHLVEGVMPGFGAINILGGKIYLSSKHVMNKASSDPSWVVVGEPVYRPFSQDERAIAMLEDGDMAVVIAAEVEYKGRKFQAIGKGILGRDEIEKRDAKGRPYPGRDTKKNRYQTLVTRAWRDLYNRFYPTNFPLSPEQDEAVAIQAELAGEDASLPPGQTATQRLQAARDAEDAAEAAKLAEDSLGQMAQCAPWVQLDEVFKRCGVRDELEFRSKDLSFHRRIRGLLADFRDMASSRRDAANALRAAEEKAQAVPAPAATPDPIPRDLAGQTPSSGVKDPVPNSASAATPPPPNRVEAASSSPAISEPPQDDIPHPADTEPAPSEAPATAEQPEGPYRVVEALLKRPKLSLEAKNLISQLRARHLVKGDDVLILNAVRDVERNMGTDSLKKLIDSLPPKRA